MEEHPMSRAFVKEIDDAPPEPLPERPISAAPNRVTPRGARLINAAVAGLEQALAAAPDEDTTRTLRRDLRYWLARQASMQILPPEPAPEAAGFGTSVTIRRGAAESTLTIVGEDEADPPAGLIAWTAPLARALEGAEPGDIVEFEAGGRTEPVQVVAVSARVE
jgi:transcription elongation GreA/GreB family factor